MKFILSSNILENSGYLNFLEEALVNYPEANFIIMGNLLNIFPENRELLSGSILYELYGRSILEKISKFTLPRCRVFKRISPFTKSLYEMFSPLGEYYQKTQIMAIRRYERMFSHMEAILGQNHMYYLAGDMDYPGLMECVMKGSSYFHSLDCKVVTVEGGTKIAGVGGTTTNVKPIPGMIDMAANEMAAEEFIRRLRNIDGVDVLVTHISPDDSHELRDFIRNSKIKLLICKEPFTPRQPRNYSNHLEIDTIKNTCIIKVKPFATKNYQAIIIDLSQGNVDLKAINTFKWSYSP